MHFLVEHNRETKDTRIQEYQSLQKAKKERFGRELKYLKSGQDEIEVVVFQSDSLDTLKQTHSRYFVKEYNEENNGNGSLAKTLLAVGLVALGVSIISDLIKKDD